MLLGTLAAFSSSNIPNMKGLNPPNIGEWVPVHVGSMSYIRRNWPKLETVPLPEKVLTVQAVNKWVNKEIQYKPESKDYWKSPLETLKDGFGDCEDFAILKHQMLNQTGYTSWVLLCYDLIRKADHALCITLFESLNNTDKSSVPIKQLQDYKPVVAINDYGVWIYGKKVR